MNHYVCSGNCGGESAKAGVCTSEGCSKEGEALVECLCEDGLHEGIVTVNDDDYNDDADHMDDVEQL